MARLQARHVVACPDCAAIQAVPPVRSGTLRCFRCRAVLERSAGRPRDGALACALATLLLLIPANLMALMSLDQFGFHSQAKLFGGVAAIWREGWPVVATSVCLAAVVLPFFRFGLLSVALGALHLGRRDRWIGPVFRWAEELDLWAMPDVFLIGIAIGWQRLMQVAHTTIGLGGWCAIGAAFLCMVTRGAIDRRRIWREIRPSRAIVSHGAFGCNACGFVVPADSEGGRCPRCGKRLWRHRPELMTVSLALTIAGMLLYPVAMLAQVSVLDWFAGSSGHSIFSSVQALINAHLYFLACCIFTTSVAIPFVKLAGVVYFYVSVRRRSDKHLVFKTRAYRLIDEMGRWSMMDVFTVVVYLPVLQFGQLASAKVGIGLPALFAVVLLTMFASRAFDPRLMWEAHSSVMIPKFAGEVRNPKHTRFNL
jgi:paraquat-inducible protein A